MTLQTETNKIVYGGLIGQSVFGYNFRVDQKPDMEVYLAAVLIPDNEWTIDGLGNALGGNVTLNVPLAEEQTVTLLRVVDETQLVDYQPFDAFPAETHEQALDKLTMIVQQLQESIGRSASVPVDSPIEFYQLGTPVAQELIVYNAAEDGQEASGKTLAQFNQDVDDTAVNAAEAAVSADESLSSANNSGAAAVSSAGSAANALDSEEKAQEWAENPEDAPVEPGEFSALHWSAKAKINAEGFPAGTVMMFRQAAAPIGWTKDEDSGINDRALRVVNGAIGSGGNQGFTTVFASGLNAGSTSLSIAMLASHNHSVNTNSWAGNNCPAPRTSPGWGGDNCGNISASPLTSGSAGSGNSHNHSLNLNLQYIDIIIASRDA